MFHFIKNHIPSILSLLIVIALLASYFLSDSARQFMQETWTVFSSGDQKRTEKFVNELGWIGPIFIVIMMTLQMFLIIVPSVLLMVAAVIAYGPIWGSLIIYLSIFTASTVGYGIGLKFGNYITGKILGDNAKEKVKDFIKDYGFWAVIVTRINPFMSNDAISFVGGLLSMGYWKFIGATLLGITPLTIYIAIIGESTDSMKSGLLWGSIVSLVVFIAYVIWDKKRKSASEKSK